MFCDRKGPLTGCYGRYLRYLPACESHYFHKTFLWMFDEVEHIYIRSHGYKYTSLFHDIDKDKHTAI